MRQLAYPWNPLHEFDRLRQQLGFDRHWSFHRSRSQFPAIRLWRNDDHLALTAELPGFNTDDLDITVKGETLTIRGARHTGSAGEGKTYRRQERANESFSRTIELPFEVDSEHVDATYVKGVLTITLQSPEEQKPKKVVINAG